MIKRLKFGVQAGLLVYFVSSYAVQKTMAFDGDYFDPVVYMEWLPPSLSREKPLASRYDTRSCCLMDIDDLHRDLFYEGIAHGYFFALLLIRQDHFVEGVPQHGPAVL